MRQYVRSAILATFWLLVDYSETILETILSILSIRLSHNHYRTDFTANFPNGVWLLGWVK